MSSTFATCAARATLPSPLSSRRRRDGAPRASRARVALASSSSSSSSSTRSDRDSKPDRKSDAIPPLAKAQAPSFDERRATDDPDRPPAPITPNKLGVHALVFTGAWDEPAATLACAGAKRAGYDIIEIPLLSPSAVDGAMTKRVVEAHGLQATTSLGLRFDADVSSADDEIAARGEALLNDALEKTIQMGGTHMCGILYSALGKYDKPVTKRGYENSIAAIKRVARRANDAGVILGLEVVNRYETNVLNTAAQAMEFISEVNEDNVRVHLDSYHMCIEERSLRQAVKTCGDKLGYVHVGESHRGQLGTGNVDFCRLFYGLAEIQYRGPITFESFSGKVVSEDLSNTLCVWRDLWEDSDALAKHARDYVERAIEAAAGAHDNTRVIVGDWF